ncbi:unnamed protein product [Gongylonema pulchrum]|uniref:Fibronectin type-III domain-containing protein n=1 Tax=Gongylonema pulchrum TaxID=637853 RepID=A0A183D1H3_9BILA|nr:unnamed protein product [Gongylonema pulchrum]
MWSDLQVTQCDDKSEPSLGYAEARDGVKCEHYRGQTFNIEPRKVSLDAWYLICYETSLDCLQCQIEVLCRNDFSSECASIWMQSSVRAITNSSMAVWVSFGDHFPLRRWTKLRKSTYVELHVENLEPSRWYFVEICTVIEPPADFLESFHLVGSLNNSSRQMCQQGLYRTKTACWNRASPFLVILYLCSFSYLFAYV